MIFLRSWILFLFLLCLGSFFFVPKSFAATITLQNGKTSLSSFTDEYSVDVSLSIQAQDLTQYFLRGVFYKPGTTNYCGYTWNGNNWFSGPYSSNGEWKQFLPITITNNSWNGQLKAKLDSLDSGCAVSGMYNFKIERFTANTGSGSFDTQIDQTVAVVIPTAIPTEQPSPNHSAGSGSSTPSKTPTIAPTHSPSSTPITKSTNTPIPVTIKTNSPTLQQISPILLSTNSSVLAASITAIPTAIVTTLPTLTKVAGIRAFNILPIIFILGGSLLLFGCGILMFWQVRKTKIKSIPGM